MDYDMTAPCDNCPFRKKGGIRLTKGRAKEIAAMMLDSQGGTFPCHKTTVESGDYDLERKATPKSKHCAGALAFAEKNGNATQMMRIVERLRLYDARKITDETKALVWDNARQWIRASD